jgi:SRSO17 transposase
MERRFEFRKEQLLADCEVSPEAFAGIIERLERFAEPFLTSLPSRESKAHGRTYMSGLLSDVERKNTESIAYRHDLDRQVLQRFIGYMDWDHEPLLDVLTRQVAAEIGEADAVIVFDPSGFPKRGADSVGVQRQWCGRLGKTENCQVGIYMGYVARTEHALVDMRLYLSKEWIADRKRRKKCGVPKEVRHQTRHEQALDMLEQRGARLPHAWIAGDDEMGRPAWFREKLNEIGERYLLAVPSNTSIRDLEAVVPPQTPVSGRRGRVSRRGPRKPPFQQMHAWCAALPEDAWTRVVIRDADKGPLEVQAIARRVESKIDRRVVGFKEMMFVTRQGSQDGRWKYDYHLSNAPTGTSLTEFARVANAEHRIEQCLQRGKSEAGLADYQTRSWVGWHHHQTLSLIAVWFLVQETRRGKKNDACVDRSPGSRGPGIDPASSLPMRQSGAYCPRENQAITAERAGKVLPLQRMQPVAAVEGASTGIS